MNRLFTYFSFVLFSFIVSSFALFEGDKKTTGDDGYLRWGERKLEWADFQGEVPDNSKFHALTHSAIHLNFETKDSTLHFHIETLFDPNSSWKTEGVNEHILEHEQIHFDITEYHTRLLRKEISNKKFHSLATVDREVREAYEKISEETKVMQEHYDHQTKHSLDPKKQSVWAKKMNRLLQKTADYQSSEIQISIHDLLKH
ncbi:MAG: hypothetical protein WDZ35_05460 [Crocinitomicaceae bacterium]